MPVVNEEISYNKQTKGGNSSKPLSLVLHSIQVFHQQY